MLRVTGIDIDCCPVCQQGQLRQVERLAPAPLAWDTSGCGIPNPSASPSSRPRRR
jgi:hypothetical protein